MDDKFSELRMEVSSSIIENAATRIAIELITNEKDGIYQKINSEIERLMKESIQKIKKEVFEEIINQIKLSNEAKNQQFLKQRLKREIKEELQPAINRWVKEEIATYSAYEIKQAAKKHFSNELLSEHKNAMIQYFIEDLKKGFRKTEAEIVPVIIDKTYEIVKDEPLPTELTLMANVYKYRIDKGLMSAPSGVYFLYKEKSLVYIGQSTCVTERIPKHIIDKDFDSAYFIPVHIGRLDHVETYLITLYNPPLNKGKGLTLYKDLNKIPTFIYDNEMCATEINNYQ